MGATEGIKQRRVMARCAFEKNKTCVLWRMDVRKKNRMDKSVRMPIGI